MIASGCARAHAKTKPDAPPLDVPAPPPRDVEPIEVEPPPVPLVAEPARNAPPRPRPKPEATAPEPARTAEEPAKPPTLQTAPTTVEGGVERGIRATLLRATTDLSRVDYRALNADARTQYDTAKRFISQADAAVKAKNLVFAKNLADKAAALAAQLGGR